ncbi:MAG TPA: CoB--CoM heterodisulfide reductase iron-sulfur subunit A family protein [candidate division Zixibacteria bacterium]|nr:CoB--CoM heterodisulfide reductase iron-sulfur subunit A family protein [candidate division Zixibacteria bacterium]
MSKPESTVNSKQTAGERIGVYLLSGVEESAVDLRAVSQFAWTLRNVVVVRTLDRPSRLHPVELAREFVTENLTHVVLAGERPGLHKGAFSRALTLAGGNGEKIRLASFAERSANITTESAKQIIADVVSTPAVGYARTDRAPAAGAQVNPATLVIGGGVAGIQASLEIAESGNKVYLVERTGTVGGRMAMFDKTFPTLDCAACILTPKMVAVGQSKNIEILVLSEVQEVTGQAGAFKVKVLKRATRVDAATCVACGDCARFCPTTVSSEFDMGIATRKCIFMPFPQAVPNTYMVDAEHCQWVQSGGKKCGACAKKCAKGAVHLDAQDEVVELEVGNIIVATGYETFDASRIARYGYGRYPNVLSSLEFERLTNASGPTGGKIVMKTKQLNKKTKQEEWVFQPDNPKPKAIAIVHCVGSRDQNFNSYCSRVCCMYSLKFAHLVREKCPEAACYEYYIDMRAYGKGYEEFSERVHEEGVNIVRGRSAQVEERDGQLYLKGEDVVNNRIVEVPVDMVLLSVGLEPSKGADTLATKLGISRDKDGWFRELDYNAEPNSTGRPGIFVAGVCQGPKDIPDTVAQASAAASCVLRTIVAANSRKEPSHGGELETGVLARS